MNAWCGRCNEDTPSTRCDSCGFWACAICLGCDSCDDAAAGPDPGEATP